MIDVLTAAGLLAITVAWLLQYLEMRKGRQNVGKEFAAVYIVGVALLIIGGYLGGEYDIAALNVVSLVAALLVFSAIAKRKQR